MRFVFWVGLLTAAVGPATLILAGKSEAGWAILISAIIVMLATRFEAIEELSFGPLRAKLAQKVDEATETLARVRGLARLTASSTLSLVKMSGRIGGYTDEEEDQIRSELTNLLKDLDCSDEELEGILKEWHRFVELDYSHMILGGSTVPENFSPDEQSEWKRLRRGGIRFIPSPEELEEFLKKTGTLDQFRSELLEDYKHYKRERQHRRPQAWSDRQNVPRLSKPEPV